MNPSILAFDRGLAVKVLDGFLHVYSAVEPKKSSMPAEVAHKATTFKGPLDAVVVALPRSAAKSAWNMLEILGTVFFAERQQNTFQHRRMQALADRPREGVQYGG